MIGKLFLPLRNVLSPQEALEDANARLENARKTKSSELALTYCNESQKALGRIRTSVKKALVSSVSVEDRVICNEIASTYFQLGKLLENLKHRDEAQTCYKKSEKWGGRAQEPGQSPSLPNHVVSPPDPDPTVDLSALNLLPTPPHLPLIQETPSRNIAIIPEHIFAKDMHQPAGINKLPKADDRLKNTSQLVHCLGLLQSS
ncbi:hypothetical protein EDD21DRAFT_449538, partial [Dissophora ornata]